MCTNNQGHTILLYLGIQNLDQWIPTRGGQGLLAGKDIQDNVQSAGDYCQEKQGRLIEPRGHADLKVIQDFMKDFGHTRIWIGIQVAQTRTDECQLRSNYGDKDNHGEPCR